MMVMITAITPSLNASSLPLLMLERELEARFQVVAVALDVGVRVAVLEMLVHQPEAEVVVATGLDINAGAQAGRVEVGQAFDEGAAVERADVGFDVGYLVEDVLDRGRDVVDAAIAAEPVLAAEADIQAVDH